MRISTLINRLWGDIAAQPLAMFMFCAVVAILAFLAAVGLVVIARRLERWARGRLDRPWKRTARGLRDTRAARRALWAQIDAALAAERKDA